MSEGTIALFIDFDNLAIGIRASRYERFDLERLLRRLVEKGRILFKRAYADWSRYPEYKRPMHEAAVELIDIPQRGVGGKNNADIRMVVDALEMCYSRSHIQTFAIASGDSDFSPLVSKLRENNKEVIGIGVKDSSSHLLIDNCDEFIFYEDLLRGQRKKSSRLDDLPPKKKEVFDLMIDAILALEREGKEVLWGSMVKQTMQRMKPTLNEGYYGYRSFTDLLEDASKEGIVDIERDDRSGSLIVLDLLVN